ncbi:MAG: thymidylate kinase [Candidatus Cloacimonetes bacterium]|nr:thymidylate kinase [Candidatus Cloacimonadota bacterium]MCF7813152.1 thymidylate kinase [Candidatus Cloacimonadota bacterium]MCF7867600.1 thymidylate kinase [Candidatus Cloacimonadota bacterium]MCF7883125.1 thymidylate kinase [Candidatus Cloacimonadota bacterium]
MKHKLIIVEGIPGSGKSTIAKKIEQYLISKNIKAKMYREGDAHPADLAWLACIPTAEYIELLNKFSEQKEIIEKNTIIEGEFALVAYLNLGFLIGQNDLMKYLESKEVYDGRVGFQIFKYLHFCRWQKFVNDTKDDEIVIFECSFLQNHVNELILVYNKDYGFIRNYLSELADIIQSLNPLMIYLKQQDVNETIRRVAAERLSPKPEIEPDWIDRVIEYIGKSKYGKMNQIIDFDGLVKYFEHRQNIELELLQDLPIKSGIVFDPDFDWKVIWNKIEAILNS